MFDVCPRCGLHEEAKTIDPAGPDAICPHCGHHHRFARLSLYVLTGASGSGKSTVCVGMPRRTQAYVFLEVDIFWQPVFNTPENDYAPFRNYCLRAAKNIAQAGRPVVLGGSAIPAQYEPAPQRRYFSQVHYLALVCSPDELTRRLQARPGWRESGHEGFIRSMIDFNQWFIDHAADYPTMTLLDTSGLSLADTLDRVMGWLQTHP